MPSIDRIARMGIGIITHRTPESGCFSIDSETSEIDWLKHNGLDIKQSNVNCQMSSSILDP